VRAGDVVKVKVIEVDVKRRRVALSMRLDEAAGSREAKPAGRGAPDDARPVSSAAKRGTHGGRRDEPRDGGVMADALKRALQSK